MTFLGWLSDPFQWLSDLQLGDEKVTLNHLVEVQEVQQEEGGKEEEKHEHEQERK